ncbi:CoA transferase subunit A [Calderihabitans maritimus]|uniref:Glutaconate CoA-transferase subunit A n=1 Tax=Calderihabitans maritimus TaxID=1246530 RepID=A0A1Z5HTM3_9FIRM|nr:CoA-transferase [Calderihabitans maritimus]GAW92681.1 glutaconate CoA-transferase subunit A [Calderihabitans maritimus]
MRILDQGRGSIFSPITPEDFRRHMRSKAQKAHTDKRMDLKTAIAEFVKPGNYLSIGGFSFVRLPMAFLWEVLRQGYVFKMAGGSRSLDFNMLLDNNMVEAVDASYILGMETLGIPYHARRLAERKEIRGELKICEWSNGTMAWRHKAAAMGVPFLPVKSLLGSDTFKYSGAKKVKCPFTGEEVALVPALYSDVAVIHVHKADMYGNCQIYGMLGDDIEKAKSARHVIITTEKIVDAEEFRRGPSPVITQFYVDAVVEVPYGAYPTNMPGLYYLDLEHLKEYLAASKDPHGKKIRAYYQKYFFNPISFQNFLDLNGGMATLERLRKLEQLHNGGENTDGFL